MSYCNFSSSIFYLFSTCVLIASLTSVSFYIINEENSISNLIKSAHTIENMFINENIEYFNKNNKITLFQNNILSHERKFKTTKYYNPDIIALPYTKNMLFNSTLLKSLFDREKNSF
ncbi:hypothetical protein CWI39_2775p0010 [Hamiltosporidium magnivora]|uniref:Uncharacterized protein n=1 Tax=Hamiltosporidium magnivora TaxID=148818 RepID=A0A4Q9KSL8_9MICR|nr:hypothetical protein CWI39_2775p0010 [Hamiltosporidium magnivora]